jgi:hypothetical protein
VKDSPGSSRQEFLRAFDDYTHSAHKLVTAWYNASEDGALDAALNSIDFPFAMSFDEYACEMRNIYFELLRRLSLSVITDRVSVRQGD